MKIRDSEKEEVTDSANSQKNSILIDFSATKKSLPDAPEKPQKRTFTYLRHLILFALVKGPQTINQISINSGINWKTAESHLTHLTGKGLIAILYQTPYLKIYQLTEKGGQYLNFLKQRYQKAHIHQVNIEDNEELAAVIKEFAVAWHRSEGLIQQASQRGGYP